MPRNPSIKKILVIGSGPIVIGQAAEFDYAGTQACSELKKEGIEVVLVNSNPATIMTDKNMADRIYIEPLTISSLQKIIQKEKPDSILANLGGQTALNLAMELHEIGFLKKHHVKLLGTPAEGIKKAEDRQAFKDTMEEINEPCIPSKVVHRVVDAIKFAKKINYPVVIRPAYTLGGNGGGIANNEKELRQIAETGLRTSRVHQILVERCVSGWKEIEFEVIRDVKGNVVTVCNMENIDPVGIHTGDSIVIAPCQTLADRELQMLRTAALKIISELKIEGGCNVQYALNPNSFEYAVIEVNPRVSRSSALASKATGYPIARVATKIAIGYNLDEIVNTVTNKTFACFEPVLDYVVVKIPKWPFAKFLTASRTLGTQMKATGEVMAIGSSFEMALMKAIRSLEESNIDGLKLFKLSKLSKKQIVNELPNINNERLWVVAEALRRGVSIQPINQITKIDTFFIFKIKKIIDMEKMLMVKQLTIDLLRQAKAYGFTDDSIAKLTNKKSSWIREKRIANNIIAQYKTVDTCAGEFEASSAYYYSSYDYGNEIDVKKHKSKKILVIGSGPIRIGQGIEFDYCSVHCVWALKQKGYEAIIVNSNPETVSTDFDIADKLYFEPLTKEDIQNIVDLEKPDGAIVQFGGQTAIKLTKHLRTMGVKIYGTSEKNMNRAEDRKEFSEALGRCNILQPSGGTIYTVTEAIKVAHQLGYPVLVRPSYVLGGQGMAIASDDKAITEYVNNINRVHQKHPILIDKYIMGRECEVDAICDGQDVLIPGIMEHLERAGIHSGDSISVYPTHTIYEEHIEKICQYTKKIALELGVIGLLNIQFIISSDRVYIIEVNPRSSRTIPYISKVTDLPIINIATNVIFGAKLKNMSYGTGLYRKAAHVAVKLPVFSFEKIKDSEISLGPEMKSTGEVLGIDKLFSDALLKAFIAGGINIPQTGNMLVTVRQKDYQELLPIVNRYVDLGFNIYATPGTGKFLKDNSVSTHIVQKIWEGDNSIPTLIKSNKIHMVINTPTTLIKNSNSDGFKIRRLAIEHRVPCFTSLDTAKALYHAIKNGKSEKDLVPVDITRI
ncbi:MAG: carbamoyl-phosphate synthase large subunit [Mycoplasmataceae bacterium]|nr:carbamoyl-phosphate synthase large subunit [Mycoplasmataceae bacterium]